MENVAIENTNLIDNASAKTLEEVSQTATNRMAGVWIWINFIVMFLALVCTGVLVAWPMLAKLAAMVTEM